MDAEERYYNPPPPPAEGSHCSVPARRSKAKQRQCKLDDYSRYLAEEPRERVSLAHCPNASNVSGNAFKEREKSKKAKAL